MMGRLRHILHPGPPAPARFQAAPCRAAPVSLLLRGGASVADAVSVALYEAGFRAAYLRLDGAVLSPLDYVIPAPAPGDGHAAWYSATRRLATDARIIHGGVHVGERDGAAFIHCHGVWQTRGDPPAMGHLLGPDSILEADCFVRGWGITGARLVSRPDPETEFTLFQPERRDDATGVGTAAVLLTLRPNQDIGHAIATAAAQHGVTHARIEGIGSLSGTAFEDGSQVESYASEILILDGALRGGSVTLDAASVGFDGHMLSGRLARGRNAICVTAEILLTATEPSAVKEPHD
mgnify:FL=1